MNLRLPAALLVVALLTGCSATVDTPPARALASSSPVTVQPLQGVGEGSTSEEGWVGDDELATTPIAGDRGDAHPEDPPSQQELQAALTTASQVIVGWLTADQAQRRETLKPVAAEALIESFDDPRFTPVVDRQVGPTHVVEAESMQVITRHRFDTGDVVDLTLILEPDTPHGWVVIAIVGH